MLIKPIGKSLLKKQKYIQILAEFTIQIFTDVVPASEDIAPFAIGLAKDEEKLLVVLLILRLCMALTKSDFDKLDARIKSITEQSVEQTEVNSDLPPTIEQLEDNNKTYSIILKESIRFRAATKRTAYTKDKLL